MLPRLISFTSIGSQDLGFLSVIQQGDQLPFSIKRVYWTYNTPDHVIRGFHSHKNLRQLLIAVNGIIDLELEDSVGTSYSFRLDDPSVGLFLPPGFWRTIRFQSSAVLLCLASDVFSEDDYIRSYEEFKK